MTTFGWKRKVGDKISKKALTISVLDDEDNEVKPSNTKDWVEKFKRRKMCLTENCTLKSDEFKEEGIKLAERGSYREAVAKWNKALQLTPSDPKLFEMKAQVLLQLNEAFPALQAAQTAVQLNPKWWIAYQTLGHTQLGLGELKMAILSFSKALHINPAIEELWEDDLNWALKLLNEQEKLSTKLQSTKDETTEDKEASKIIFDENGFIKEEKSSDVDTAEEISELVQCRF